MLLPTSCNFGPLGASPQPPMAVSSCCHLLLPWQQHPQVDLGTNLPIYHSPQLAGSLNKRRPSYFAIMLCSQAQLFPVLGKGEAQLGNSSHICFFSTVSKANSKHPQESRCEMWMVLGQRCWVTTTGSRLKAQEQKSAPNTSYSDSFPYCLWGLTGNFLPCGFGRLLEDTHEDFTVTRQHQKYKDFGVIAHPKS